MVTTFYQNPPQPTKYILKPLIPLLSITFSEALRYSHICSYRNDRELHYCQLKNNLQKLGYHTESVDAQINTTWSISRDLLLQYKPNSEKKNILSPTLSFTD